MAIQTRLLGQFRRNTVALISLVVAVTSLSYNTWRNEQTEYNRNQRQAAFQLIVTLAELDQVVNHRHYGDETVAASHLRAGWALVNTIDVLTAILEPPLPVAGDRLELAWERNAGQLGGEHEAPVVAIRSRIDALQAEAVDLVHRLE